MQFDTYSSQLMTMPSISLTDEPFLPG